MDKLFQSKWFIRIISLALAITLYLFVTVETDEADDSRIPTGSSNEVQVIDEMPLGIKIDSENYVVSGVPEHVKVTLEGRTSVITPIVRQQNFNVFVDLRDLTEGEHTVEVEYENIPENVTVYIEPKTIDVIIEKRMAKEFQVQVELINEDQLPLGYELGVPVVEPQTVTLISSEAIIEQVALVKVYIDVKDLTESIRNRELPVNVYDIQGNDLNVRVEPETVMVSLQVDRPSKLVPLKVRTTGELPDDLELEAIEAPEEIEIFGKRAILNEITEVQTEEIDLSKITKSDTIEVDIDFPEGTTADKETVKVTLKLNKRKIFNDVSIPNQLANGTTYDILTPENAKVDVEAFGSDLVIDRLQKSDIRAIVNLSNTTSGTHEVDLTIEGPRGITLESEPKKITISIP